VNVTSWHFLHLLVFRAEVHRSRSPHQIPKAQLPNHFIFNSKRKTSCRTSRSGFLPFFSLPLLIHIPLYPQVVPFTCNLFLLAFSASVTPNLPSCLLFATSYFTRRLFEVYRVKMVADLLVYHPTVAHYLRFVATTGTAPFSLGPFFPVIYRSKVAFDALFGISSSNHQPPCSGRIMN
jgi:hypothetical protein